MFTDAYARKEKIYHVSVPVNIPVIMKTYTLSKWKDAGQGRYMFSPHVDERPERLYVLEFIDLFSRYDLEFPLS